MNKNNLKSYTTFPQFLLSVLAPALQIQYILGFGFLFSLVVSLYYYFLKDPRYPTENPLIFLVAMGLSFGCFVLGNWLIKRFSIKNHLSLRRGAWIVTLAWVLSCTISALFFVLAGFPDPSRVQEFSLLRRFIDGWYESMSGFTTTGSTILASVEIFPRGVLMWRSLTHWFGGMGIAYLAVTLWKGFAFKRGPIINSEAETPNIIEYKDEQEAIMSGKDFLKAYSILTLTLAVLLFISGLLFRHTPYQTIHENVFESVNYAFSTLGTGGFGVHDASSGLPIIENGKQIIGGLRNSVSDWIIGFFMFFSGMNFSLWYLIFFKRDWKTVKNNTELRWYLVFCTSIVLSIWYFLVKYNTYPTIWEALRYSLFNMATIVSTTGLADWNFHFWPSEAQGILFICYLVGGMVGSTAGGLKITRYMVAYKYISNEIKNFILGTNTDSFEIDGITYTSKSAGLITATIAIYYIIFFLGAISLMVTSHDTTLPSGQTAKLDFGVAMASSIANLGNIGPAVAIGSVNAGPTGNYFSFTEMGKVIMILLMFIGRIGIPTFLMLFITERGEANLGQSVAEKSFNEKKPRLRQ